MTIILYINLFRNVKKGLLQRLSVGRKGKAPIDYHSPGAQMVKDLHSSMLADFDIIDTPTIERKVEKKIEKKAEKVSSFFKRSFSFNTKSTITRSMSTTELWRKYPTTFRF